MQLSLMDYFFCVLSQQFLFRTSFIEIGFTPCLVYVMKVFSGKHIFVLFLLHRPECEDTSHHRPPLPVCLSVISDKDSYQVSAISTHTELSKTSERTKHVLYVTTVAV